MNVELRGLREPSVASRLLAGFVLLSMVLAAAGCGDDGPRLGTVSGRVLVDGKPVEQLRIEFQPASGGSPSTARTDAQGRYELHYTRDKDGAMVGRHCVRITAPTIERDDAGNLDEIPQLVPPRYNDQTELVVEVEPGHNEHSFELSTGP